MTPREKATRMLANEAGKMGETYRKEAEGHAANGARYAETFATETSQAFFGLSDRLIDEADAMAEALRSNDVSRKV